MKDPAKDKTFRGYGLLAVRRGSPGKRHCPTGDKLVAAHVRNHYYNDLAFVKNGFRIVRNR